VTFLFPSFFAAKSAASAAAFLAVSAASLACSA